MYNKIMNKFNIGTCYELRWYHYKTKQEVILSTSNEKHTKEALEKIISEKIDEGTYSRENGYFAEIKKAIYFFVESNVQKYDKTLFTDIIEFDEIKGED